MSKLELNISHTGVGLGVTSKETLDLTRAKFQAESLISGGKHFQKHRYTLQPSYVANCIHDNSGLISVGFQEHDTKIIGAPCDIASVPCCEECNQFPFLHNGISFIHRNKGFLFTEHNELYLLGCDLATTFVELRGIDPIQLRSVVDIISVQGKRIIIMTKDEIYYSSLLDGTGKEGNWNSDDVDSKPYIDFYNLGGATGKFSISASIGHNKKLVVVADLLYFLGSSGGVVTRQCNQDELYPFELSVVSDFDGIAHKDHASVRSSFLSSFLVYSVNGLGEISKDRFTPVLDEISDELHRDMAVYFKVEECGEVLFEESCSPCEGSIIESSCITSQVLTSFRPEETITEEGDYKDEDLDQWDDPLIFEQGGSKPTHFKITTTAKYFAISHNSGKEISPCDKSCVCYNRIYLYDRRLLVGTVLHIEHKDVTMIEGELYILNQGLVRKMVLRADKTMPSMVYYKGLEIYQDKWVQLTELNLAGRFLGTEQDTGEFNHPIFSVHTDDSGFFYHDSMDLYHFSQQHKSYGNVIRGRTLDILIPFAGFLASVKLVHHR